MQCPHCHADNQEGRYCVKCGKPLEENTTELDETIAMQAVIPDETTLGEAHDAPKADASSPSDATSDDDTSEEVSEETANEETSEEATNVENITKPSAEAINEWARGNDDFFEEFEAEDKKDRSRTKKIITALALICGLTLAAGSAYYLFDRYFGHSDLASEDTNRAIADADIVAADGAVAADSIVGHWRHYNTGSLIEKIGNERYRWTIEESVYELRFKDDVYQLEDDEGNLYSFVLNGPDQIKLASSTDADGGLIKNPVFDSGFTAGRVGQDGSMAHNLSLNTDAFNIVGKTYAELAGTYGPGALSVVGDEQYIVFRGKGGNFSVQFSGNTVPLSEQQPFGKNFRIVKLSSDNTGTIDDSTDNGSTTTEPNVTTPDTNNSTGGSTAGNNSSSTTDNNKDKEKEEDKKYTVEIPDMPTFPSTTAVATGVVWVDLGFLINNASDTMTVNDLAAILGISLEVGEAGANASGFYFYGMDEGYFSGTIGLNDHTYNISGYGKDNLDPGKTIVFIQQVG